MVQNILVVGILTSTVYKFLSISRSQCVFWLGSG